MAQKKTSRRHSGPKIDLYAGEVVATRNRLFKMSASKTVGSEHASVLVANRAEIACRIIKACHKLGLRAIAVFTEPGALTSFRVLHLQQNQHTDSRSASNSCSRKQCG